MSTANLRQRANTMTPQEVEAGQNCGTQPQDLQWMNTECCGVTCAIVTWFLLLFADYVVSLHVILPWLGVSFHGLLHGIAFNGLVFLAIASHLRAMLTDPGAVPPSACPLDYEPGSAKFRVCRRCNSYKPVRAHHCSICNRCVVKMDHHCPWVNNCVALGNHKFFLLFIFYVHLCSVYALVLVVSHFVQCAGRSRKGSYHERCGTGGGSHGMMVAVLIEAILFGLFTLCMICDQWSVVTTNTTQIDRLKGESAEFDDNGRRRTMCDNLAEVFGGEPRFSIEWLLPVPVRFLDKETALGYRLRSEHELQIELGGVVELGKAGATGSSLIGSAVGPGEQLASMSTLSASNPERAPIMARCAEGAATGGAVGTLYAVAAAAAGVDMDNDLHGSVEQV